jgi:uncharacterized protein (TIGR03382 family)
MNPIENYMDYSDDSCMTRFTPEQVNRLRCSLVNYRKPNTEPVAGFRYELANGELRLTNTSDDAQSTAGELEYRWVFGDGVTSTERDPVHRFAAPGTYEVALEVFDPGSGSNTASASITVGGRPNGSGGGAEVTGGCAAAGGTGAALPLVAFLCAWLPRRRRR